jgi:hypothetical protein
MGSGQTDPLLRLCRTISSRSSALVILTSISLRVAGSRNERARGSIMSAREIQDQKAIAREMLVQQPAYAKADVPASPLRGATICSTKSRRDSTLESTADEFCEAAEPSLLPVIRVDAANLMRVLRQSEVLAKRQAPRIAFKAKGSILLLDLADILAVQAEGNYVSLQHRPNPYLVHESLIHSGEAQTVRFYSHPPLGRREYFGRGGDPTFTDGGVQAACERWEEIPGNAYIQTQPQRSGSTVGRLRAALRLTGSKRFTLAIPS